MKLISVPYNSLVFDQTYQLNVKELKRKGACQVHVLVFEQTEKSGQTELRALYSIVPKLLKEGTQKVRLQIPD